jgi:hypothetical protein
MTKLTVDAALDHKVAHAMGLKSVHNCEKWVGLTDEEIDDIYWQHTNHSGNYEVPIWPYERAIEAKLKEKNT